jgi:hypothetical protein
VPDVGCRFPSPEGVLWRGGLKAFGIACVVYFAETMAQTLYGCPVSDPTCSCDTPPKGRVLLVTALSLLLALGVFLFRAIRRERTWKL